MKIKMFSAVSLLSVCMTAALLLSACQVNGTGSSSVSSSAVSSAVSSSAAETPAPTETVPSSASTSAPAELPDGLPDALSASLGWGGDAGSSLKSMIAACALLDWAEDNHAAALDCTQLSAAATQWLAALDDESYSTFVTNWEGVRSNADLVLSDPDSVAGLLDDAGNPNQHETYTQTDWDTLKAAIEFGIAAQSRAAVTV